MTHTIQLRSPAHITENIQFSSILNEKGEKTANMDKPDNFALLASTCVNLKNLCESLIKLDMTMKKYIAETNMNQENKE